MTETIEHSIYIQTAPASDSWLNITHDVHVKGIKWTKGIPSSHPLDRIASVGMLNILLRNDGATGAENRYTPGHANCTSGFQVRAKIKILSVWQGIEKIQWVGWIPPNGIQQIRRGQLALTQVSAVDWMYFALNSPVTLTEIQTDQTFGDIVITLSSLLTAQTGRIDTTAYEETFATSQDTVRENTTIYTEIDKAAKSELGYCYIKYEARTGASDILTIEGRQSRSETKKFNAYPLTDDESPELLTEDDLYYLTTEDEEPLLADSGEEFAALAGVTDYKVVNGAHYANRWLGKTYPRRVGSAEVIFMLNTPLKLESGEVRENLRVRYAVIDGYAGISAQNVSITHAAMNSQADGLGDDLTADLDISGTFGAGDAALRIENTSNQEAWITEIEISGDPVYIGDTVTQVVDVDSDDDSLFGQIEMTLDQKYQSDPMRTLGHISVLAVRYSQRTNTVEEVIFCANRNRILASVYMLTDIGGRIPLEVVEYGLREDYYIQGVDTWMDGLYTWCKLYLKPARLDSYRFWKLGEPGYSELGATTTLGIET